MKTTPIQLPTMLLALVSSHLMTAAAAPPQLQAVDEAEFAKILSSEAKIETLATGLQFTEGPVWYGGPNGFLIFSDIPADQLMKWSAKSGLTVFRNPSQKANGNTLDRQGHLITCEHGGRRVSRTLPDGQVETLVDRYQDKPLNSPNDAVVKSDGTIWFTDPDYGLEGRPKEQPGNYVYRFDPKTKNLTALLTDFDKPNGLCFSPDESLLYVADSGRPRHIRVFPVQEDNSLGQDKVFAALDQGGPDGIRSDADGRVWSSSGDGVQVFLPEGKLVARILLPKAGANLCFGGPDGSTVFVTARDALYCVETRVQGGEKPRWAKALTPPQPPAPLSVRVARQQ